MDPVDNKTEDAFEAQGRGDALPALPHRRQNLLTGEWVLVSPHRMNRPWQGERVVTPTAARPAHDPECYLCPGNTRAGGARNPTYASTWVFPNDFPALLEEETPPLPQHPLFRGEAVRGTCRVICFSPRHDLTLPDLDLPSLRAVVDVWASEVQELSKRHRWVQVFENKGAAMGCSNPHPHGQVWALDALPNEARKEDDAQRAWWRARGTSLLLDVVAAERASGARVVVDNGEWVAFVPFWALWPFETLLVPVRPVHHLHVLDDTQRDALADAVKRLTTRYDQLFGVSFPYSMGWHGAPFQGDGGSDGGDGGGGGPAGHDGSWQLHAHFYPPLLRSATVKKFMVGFEMLAEGQRDLTPERAAAALRAAGDAAPPSTSNPSA